MALFPIILLAKIYGLQVPTGLIAPLRCDHCHSVRSNPLAKGKTHPKTIGKTKLSDMVRFGRAYRGGDVHHVGVALNVHEALDLHRPIDSHLAHVVAA